MKMVDSTELKFYRTKTEALARKREYEEETFLIAREYLYHTEPSRTFYRYGLIPISKADSFYRLVHEHDVHLNEIVPHGIPVRMYFDIEQHIDADMDWRSSGLLQLAYDELSVMWQQQFEVEIPLSDFIITTASRPGKLSFRMVCNRNDIFFSCNSIQRLWVQWVVQELRAKASHLIYSFSGQEKCSIDSTVYGVDQVFGLIYQSKVKFPDYPRVPMPHHENDAIDVARNSTALIHHHLLLGTELDTGLVFSTPATVDKRSKKRPAPSNGSKSIELQQEGPRLYDTIQKERWTTMDLIEKHLSVIPNQSQPKNIWLAVGRAIKVAVTKNNRHRDVKIDGLQLFAKWSALADIYTATRCENAYNSFLDEPSVDDSDLIGLPYLIKLARECSPELFKYSIHEFEEYFSVNYDGIRVINETCPFVSDPRSEEFKNDIFSPEKFLIIDAYLGKGKTTAVKRLIADGISILVLSTRVTFAKFIAGEFQIDCYLDGDKFESRRLVCSVESLLKVKTDKFDLIVLDESESILSQFCSITLKGLQVPIWNKLASFVRNSSKVVLSDAFLTRRTFDFVHSFAVGTICLIRNPALPEQRTAIELNQDDFLHVLLESLNKGENNYICYSTLRRQKDFLLAVKTTYPEQMDSILVYNSQVGDEVFESLDNVNLEWRKGSVCTTPTFTVGSSFAPKDTDGNDIVHFDSVFLNLYPSCTVRDIFQTHMRVRHLKSNKLFFCLPTKREAAFAKTRVPAIMSTIEDFNDNGTDKLRLLLKSLECFTDVIRVSVLNTIIDNIYRSVDLPEALKQAVQFNLFEAAMSITHYNELTKEFLKRCNYAVTELVVNADHIQPDPEEFVPFKDIDDLSDEQIQVTRCVIAKKEASIDDKLQWDKYWFKKLIALRPGLSNEALTACFHLFYRDNTNRQFLLNTSFELSQLTEQERVERFVLEIRTSGCIHLNKSYSSQKQQIQELNRLLGIPSSVHGDGVIFNSDLLRSIIPYIESNKKSLSLLFSIRSRSDQQTPQAAVRFLDSIYNNWNGSKFAVVKKFKKVAVEWTLRHKFSHEDGCKIENFF